MSALEVEPGLVLDRDNRLITLNGQPCFLVLADGDVACTDCGVVGLRESWMTHTCQEAA